MNSTTIPARDGHDQVVDLSANGRDYEFTARLAIELDVPSVSGRAGQVGQEYPLMAGRHEGGWRLSVHEHMSDDIHTEFGPAIVQRHDQREGPDPMTLLRALLTGQAA